MSAKHAVSKELSAFEISYCRLEEELVDATLLLTRGAIRTSFQYTRIIIARQERHTRKHPQELAHSGSRYNVAGKTLPAPKGMSLEVMQSIFDFRLDVNNKVLLETGVVGSIVFQPFPRSIAQKALELGVSHFLGTPLHYCC